MKKKLKFIRGLKPKQNFVALLPDLKTTIDIRKDDFLVRQGKSQSKPFHIYGTDHFAHIPTSLCSRYRIAVNEHGEIVHRSRCYTRNK